MVYCETVIYFLKDTLLRNFYFVSRANRIVGTFLHFTKKKTRNIANNKYFVQGSLLMFGRGKIKPGEYVFVSQKYDRFNRLVIG